jgi:addiction module HigA family antidote
MSKIATGPNCSPAAPTTPGVFLKSLIRSKTPRIRQSDLADALQVSRLTVNMVLNGKSAVTPDMALRLEAVLGISPLQLLEMQAECDLFAARKRISDRLSAMTRLANMTY